MKIIGLIILLMQTQAFNLFAADSKNNVDAIRNGIIKINAGFYNASIPVYTELNNFRNEIKILQINSTSVAAIAGVNKDDINLERITLDSLLTEYNKLSGYETEADSLAKCFQNISNSFNYFFIIKRLSD